ncbi:MAG: rod shape-determining protein MreC [Solirubrobacteraceae bacterium]|nr:rod shape-determining protein MreC [Solirubrobacteraceae bacterium]
MYDKTVRRRRAVLGLLVACSLILLTAYFGESGGGVLHGVQRGTSEVLNPVQEGASRALKPVRDLFGWFGDTLAAKSDLKKLTAERDRLRGELALRDNAQYENRRMAKLLQTTQALGLSDYAPKTARVFATSPTVWYATIRVDKGSSDGVRLGQPVINEQALIGRVTAVFNGAAQVTLLTDTSASGTSAGVSARAGKDNVFGVVEPVGAGNPNDLLLDNVAPSADLNPGDRVYTRGTIPGEAQGSLYPRGLPIGVITRIDHEGTDTEEVHLRPYANMRDLDYVQILTKPKGIGA